MNISQPSQSTGRLSPRWTRVLTLLLWLLAGLTFALGSLWMLYKFDQLLFDNRYLSATPTWPVDLMDTRQQIQGLFRGEPVYLTSNSAVYPPATYLALWPLLGWVDEWGARVVWALTTLVSLGWLGWLLIRTTGERAPVRRVLLALLPFVLLASGLTIGAGQLGNHVLPPLLLSLMLLPRPDQPARWGRDLLVACLFTLALVKPTFSAPFFWLIIFLPGRLRPAVLVVALYGALTVGMSLFQAANPVVLILQWLEVGREGVVWGARTGGLNNVQAGAYWLGLLDYSIEISLLILAAWGGWVFFYRRQNAWLLIGATAIVARLWIYHRNYDDMLLLLPLIAFYRLTRTEGWRSPLGSISTIFLALGLFTLVIPFGSDRLPVMWVNAYQVAQVLIWLAMLLFFAMRVEQTRQRVALGRLASDQHAALPNL